MPHPHEQKLHEVVNSLTSESFKSFVAARTSETSRSPSSARSRSPQRVSLSRSRRLTVGAGAAAVPGLSERFWSEHQGFIHGLPPRDRVRPLSRGRPGKPLDFVLGPEIRCGEARTRSSPA